MGVVKRWTWILMAVAASTAVAGETTYEQTYDVTEGAWLEIECPAGSILVDTWEKSQVEVVVYHDAEVEVRSRQYRGDVQVGSVSDKGWKSEAEYEIRVPAWMNVGISGNETSVDIRGVQGQIEVETIDGDVDVKGGKEKVVLHSVKGDVRLEDASGAMDLESTNGEITVVDSEGELIINAMNGDVRCGNVRSSMAEAETINGDIFFDGILSDQGDYYFTTHVGDIELTVPGDVNVAVTAVTYHGDFDTDFELSTSPEVERVIQQRRWSLDIGKATATLRAESFQGDINLFSSKRGRGKRN
jgi:DUF4097 and DUF4098 domain-containing protein YvlB